MEIRDIPVERIQPNPNNPRREFDDIEGLAASIAREGLLQPLLVVEDGGSYRLIDGERRLRALKLRRVQTAPCSVMRPETAQDEQVWISAGNSNRADLTDEERARGVQMMMYLGVDEGRAASASGASAEEVGAMGFAVAELRKREAKARELNAVRSDPAWQMSFADAARVQEFADSEADVACLLHTAEHRGREEFLREYWEIRGRREAERRSEESYAAVSEAQAELVGWDDFEAMEYGKDYVSWIGSKPVGKSGCGCDGFSAAIDPEDGRVHWFCAKPGNHGGGETDEERAGRERREAWQEAREARREWILEEVSGIDGTARLNPWVNKALAERFSREFDKLAGEGNPMGLPRDFRTSCLAAAVNGAETSLYNLVENDFDWNDDARERWLAMYDELVRLGYVPSGIEADAARAARDILDRHAAEAADKDGGE